MVTAFLLIVCEPQRIHELGQALADLEGVVRQVDVAIAVNSLVLPSLGRLEAALHGAAFYGLPRVTTYAQISSDPTVQNQLLLAYGRLRAAGQHG